MAVNSPMLFPNCSLSIEYLTALDKANLDPPMVAADSLILPELSMFNAILKPSFLLPSRFSIGTGQFSKYTCLVEDPFIPSFFSSSPNVIPPKDFSMINAESFSSSSIFAKTIKTSAKPELVIHIF